MRQLEALSVLAQARYDFTDLVNAPGPAADVKVRYAVTRVQRQCELDSASFLASLLAPVLACCPPVQAWYHSARENVLLKKAVEWDVVERMPCTIRLLPIPKPSAGFYDFDEYEALVVAAKTQDPNAYLIVLLGGEAGLRCGEMIALEWSDVNVGQQLATAESRRG